MATTRSQDDSKGTLALSVASVADAYQTMEIPVRRYFLLYVLPSLVFFVGTMGAAIVAPLPLLARIPIPALGLLAVFSVLVYPKLLENKRKAEMGDRMHLFVTHLTILSTTNIDRVSVFRALSQEKEYKALADEMKKIVQLVDAWNQSLDDACRRRAKEVPDEDLAAFLERMAYSLNAGQELNDFLMSEQDALIRNYVTHYKSSLENLEVMKDLYLSMILSMTFALVFATVLPILTGTDPVFVILSVLILFLLVQVGFLYTVRVITPNDPLWYTNESKKPFERKLVAAVIAGMVGSMLIIVFGIVSALEVTAIGDAVPQIHTEIPVPFYIAIPATPLLIPALIVRREEKRIRERDDEFSTFIRALGSTESVKQSTTDNVLETLRTRDFGALNDNVDSLYRRLKMRIDSGKAWKHFILESRSYLIQKFSEMYAVGREKGGDPKVLGELISQNMGEVLQLREERKQSTVTFIGLLYGVSAAAAFAFFIGIEVVEVLATFSADLELQDLEVGQFIYPGVYDIPLIRYIILVIIVINATLSSLMIRTVDDGHKVNTFLHFVLLLWIGATVGWFTSEMVEIFLSVG